MVTSRYRGAIKKYGICSMDIKNNGQLNLIKDALAPED